MILTKENYHSKEAGWAYMSNSQYKGFLKCEARELATLKGEYEEEQKDCLVEGSYLHAWSEGIEALEKFRIDHPEMFSSTGKTKGELKANFKHIEKMISVLQDDEFVMFCLEGEKEKILTANLFGVPWKICIDVFRNDTNVEIKTVKSIRELTWSDKHRAKVTFIDAMDYMVQAAIYAEVRRVALGEEKLPQSIMVAVSKESSPDKELINLSDHVRFSFELQNIEMNLPHILQVKNGEIAPKRCERCDYCRQTKEITRIIPYTELAF